MYRLAGPGAGRLMSRYGGHYVCIFGALLATVGLLAASFVNTIFQLIVTYSIVAGLGFGLMYIPSVVACVPYFTKRRSLAIGICLCGSGFGTFSLAPLTQYILENWGWRWVMRTLSGLSFLGVLCGCTMRTPVSPSPVNVSQVQQSGPRQRKSNRFLLLVLGEDLMQSSRLRSYFLFLLTDFLSYVSIYIPYTYLPRFAEVGRNY